MKQHQLVEKLETSVSYAPDVMQALAKNAFLLNLFNRLDVDPDEGQPVVVKDNNPATLTRHLLAILRRHKKNVPDQAVRNAHCDMAFPWSRAIISACLYGKNVSCTPLGVPKSYGAA